MFSSPIFNILAVFILPYHNITYNRFGYRGSHIGTHYGRRAIYSYGFVPTDMTENRHSYRDLGFRQYTTFYL